LAHRAPHLLGEPIRPVGRDACRGRSQIQKTQTEKIMTKAIHGSFTIDRVYDASPARVFKAFADPKSKARWFVGEGGWQEIKRELDFRPGGQEVVHGKFPNGSESRFVARYHEIVPNERLVYVYDMHANGVFMSVS